MARKENAPNASYLRRHPLGSTLVGLTGFLTLTAFSCDERGLGDAPVGTKHESPRTVFVNPDTFPNLVATCVGDNLIITTTREAAPVAIPNAEECQEGGQFYVAEEQQ